MRLLSAIVISACLVVVADINSYKDTVTSAKREADAATYAELNKPEYF